MSPQTYWLGRAAGALVLMAAQLALVVSFGAPQSLGRVALRTYRAHLDSRLTFLRATIASKHVLVAQAAAAVSLLVAGAFGAGWLWLLLLPVAAGGPHVALEAHVARRVARIEEQLESWLNAIANALKAGPSLGEAIASSASIVQAPMSQEIDLLVKQYELGTPLDAALEALAARAQSKTVAGAVLALKIARRSGGNLPEVLESTAAALRELARLDGVVRSKTAEGRAQAFIIGVIPIPMVLGIDALDPHFFEPLAQTSTGHWVIAGAVVLWALAVVLARQILDVRV